MKSALDGGQKSVSVHVFPFRMTKNAMTKVKGHKWEHFWRNLKQGHDWFEKERIAPGVAVCKKKYVVGRVRAKAGCEMIAAE